MWEVIWQEFDISHVSKIGAIRIKVISKSFTKFASIDNYCQSYLEAYNEIANWLANKNDYKQ